MAGEVLKEYLVALGFEVDEASLKRWGAALGGTTGQLLKFAGVLTAAATATYAFTDAITKRMDDLYWATLRIGSSANNIQSYELAMKKMGGTAENARASLESLARQIRINPATEAFVNTLGVKTREVGGGLRDMSIVMRDLAQQFSKMPYWVSNMWAEKLGISEDDLWRMTHGLNAFGDAYGKLYARMGISPAQATKASKDFQNSLKDIGATFDVIEVKLMTAVEPRLRDLNLWLVELFSNTKKSTDGTNVMSRALSNLGEAAGDLGQILKLVGSLAKVAISIISFMPPEALEFGIIGYFLFGKKGALIGIWLGQITNALDRLVGDAKKVNETKVKEYGEGDNYKFARWNYAHGLTFLNSNEFNETYAEYLRRKNQNSNPPEFNTDNNQTNVGGDTSSTTNNQYEGDQNTTHNRYGDRHQTDNRYENDVTNNQWVWTPSSDDKNNQPPPNGIEPRGVRNNNPGNLRFWDMNRPIDEKGFTRFDNAAQGIAAMASNLQKYAKRGWDTVAKIVSHWAPQGIDGNDTAAYVNDVKKQIGVNSDQHLNLNDPGMVQRLIKAMIRHENGYDPYNDQLVAASVNSRMGFIAPPPQKSGNKTINIKQTNEFHIESSSEVRAVTKNISDEMGRVNGDLVRDAKSALF